MKRKLKNILLLCVVAFIMHGVVIAVDGLMDDKSPQANVAVILGSTVNTDGSLSDRLKSRLDSGLRLYQESVVNKIYVSGGLGKEGFYEGTKMADYLVSQGVPRNLITVDNNGINTRSTAMNFIKDFPSETSAIIVTQYFHVTRTKLAFRQVGVEKVYGVHARYFAIRDVYSTTREIVGFYKYLIFY